MRRNIGSIDHIAFKYADPEALNAARQTFTDVLGIDDFTSIWTASQPGSPRDPARLGLPFPVDVFRSYASGLEFTATIGDLAPDHPARQHIAKHGGGFYSLVFGVEDLEQSLERAARHGVHAEHVIDVPQVILDIGGFEKGHDAFLGNVAGINLVIGEIVPLDESAPPPGIQPRSGGQNIGAADHVVLLYRDRERLEAARQTFTDVLGIGDFTALWTASEPGSTRDPERFDLPFPVDAFRSYESGIELVAPARELPDDHPLAEHLATHGEGFFALAFGVADLDHALEQAARHGVHAKYVFDFPEDMLEVGGFVKIRDAFLGPIAHVNVVIGEMVPNGER